MNTFQTHRQAAHPKTNQKKTNQEKTNTLKSDPRSANNQRSAKNQRSANKSSTQTQSIEQLQIDWLGHNTTPTPAPASTQIRTNPEPPEQLEQLEQLEQKEQSPAENAASLLDHPLLWRAGQLSRHTGDTQGIATGYSELDKLLPGAGWPSTGLAEFLLPSVGVGEIRLLAPALKYLSQVQERWITWINPPFIPFAPGLQAVGINPDKMLLVHPNKGVQKQGVQNKAEQSRNKQNRGEQSRRQQNRSEQKRTQQKLLLNRHLWAIERACKSGTCSVVLAWLGNHSLTLKDTQRLQIAARQGGTLACLMRPMNAHQQASMAELRVSLQPSNTTGQVRLDILKRRGGWPVQNLQLQVDEVTQTTHRNTEELQQQLKMWSLNAPQSATQPVSTDLSSQALQHNTLPQHPVH